MQKFKVGQQVKIRHDLIVGNDYPHYDRDSDIITPSMWTLGGMITVIIDEDVDTGYILNGAVGWVWPSSTLIPAQPFQTKRRSYV